jgi:hypothetical protein
MSENIVSIDHGLAIAQLHGVPARSPHWAKVEKEHLIMEPYCRACGPNMNKAFKVQIHHAIPYHYCILLGRPDLELCHKNLISLCESEHDSSCENHHLLIGHLKNFKSGNLNVRIDAETTFQGFTAQKILESTIFQEKLINGRIKPWEEMTDQDKKDLRALMDLWYPLAS